MTGPMSPSETLRAAAAKLREMAKDATQERWRVEYAYGGKEPQAVWTMDPEFPGDVDMSVGIGGFTRPGDNAWAVAMSPTVAGALAEWLEVETLRYESHVIARPHDAALAFARCILEGQP